MARPRLPFAPFVLSCWWLAGAAPGCAGGALDGVDPEPEVAVAPCAAAFVDEAGEPVGVVEIAPGRPARLALDAPDDATVSLSAPEGVLAELEGSEVTVKDAGLRGPLTLEAAVSCGAETATAALDVTPRLPRVSELASWTPGEDGPPGREYFSMWMDPLEPSRLWLFGGFQYEPQQFTPSNDLWSYDVVDGSWTAVAPAGELPLLAGGGLAVEPAAGRALYYGGLGRDEQGFLLPYSLVELDHEGAGVVATDLGPGPATAAMYQPAFFFHPRTGRFITLGGTRYDGATTMAGRVYDPERGEWSTLDTGGGLQGPSGRTGFFWAYDEVTDRFVVFSGEQGGTSGACNCATDTWALELGEEPARWVRLDVDDGAPAGRRNGAYALDPVGHRLLVFGGTADGLNAEPGVFALSLERGAEAWTELTFEDGAAAPTARASGGMVYDAERDRMLVGFGNDSRHGPYVDLWAIDL